MIKRFIPIVLGLSIFGGCRGNPPAHLGVRDGGLFPCPESPNCVSTQSEDDAHRMEPLEYQGTRNETMDRILQVVNDMKRTRIVVQEDEYLHVEYRSLVGFVDDVEFYLDEKTRTVHFRSASRLGYSDLGVNRKRMEQFREMYGGL